MPSISMYSVATGSPAAGGNPRRAAWRRSDSSRPAQSAPDQLGLALDRLDAHRQAGQLLQQGPAACEGRNAADQRLQPPHARRVLSALDVQLGVARSEAAPALPAVVVEPLQHHAAQQRDELLGPRSLALQALPAGAREGGVLVRLVGAQQPLQHGGAGPLQRIARGLLQRLQVEGPAALAGAGPPPSGSARLRGRPRPGSRGPFFFDRPGALRHGGRPEPADGEIDVEELAGQLLELAVGGDLALGLAAGGLVGQAFGDGLALALVGEAPVRAVARLAGLVAVAGGLAATPAGGRDRPGAEVPQQQEAPKQGVALGFEIGEGGGHGSCPCVQYTQGTAALL